MNIGVWGGAEEVRQRKKCHLRKKRNSGGSEGIRNKLHYRHYFEKKMIVYFFLEISSESMATREATEIKEESVAAKALEKEDQGEELKAR